MRKLKAIWQLLWADKWAVFSFEDYAPNPAWQKIPHFKSTVSHRDKEFFWFIKQRIQNIIESEANNE
ncbi:MAG: hypothetical protein IJN06_06610 [Bacteroidales bacterium]|nr:hypothetical protein [Bacteroidales bacterium]MBR6626438.1 hypothetical protein [Lachnospiraceae bacterium]